MRHPMRDLDVAGPMAVAVVLLYDTHTNENASTQWLEEREREREIGEYM